ncbi:hypothetical protein BS50DRAFT_485377 [Corynespora cassiicola Philippines]|uniref:Stress response protein Rds1 n=1 Tax=Corynespora cassiicola Philippines TaxID=1448308 RepID=A0A2T2P2H3_CORCC|nr:hypothetical protein BS50DRAFT_485377 [Corynespora cassiicola Philippines]
MLSRAFYASALLSTLATGAPAPQVDGYNNADASFSVSQPEGPVATSFGPDSQIPAIQTQAPPPPVRLSPDPTGATSHGPYEGTPTTTGAVMADTTLADSIDPLPPNPTATYYNPEGKLLNPAPAPYTPNGGLGTNGTEPRYMVNSDFDFESIALGLYQEWIELDLFNNGLAVFSDDDFLEAGLTAEDRAYIAFMAIQETGHATLLSNMLGEAAPKQCTYNYPFRTVREFIDFNQKLTRFGESGVWGFINHLDSREVGQMLSQSIATEARQQLSFRQMLGLPPMPVWFETGIPQSWAWTYLAPYISSCPEGQTRLAWQNFPGLHFVNQPNPNRVSANDTEAGEVVGNRTADPSDSTIPADESCVNVNVTGYSCGPAIARNRSEPLSFPGRQVNLTWEAPGMAVGPNNSYITATSAGEPQFVAWVSQLNLTYTPLTKTGDFEGFTYQPAGDVFEGDPIVNGTMFVALTDSDLFLTPFNLSMINPHVVALGLYQAG